MGNGSRTPTVDQLRKDIDRGQAGDKVAGVDPAATPLGTDSEAGGHPPTREEREMEARAMHREPPKRSEGGDDATESIREAEVRDHERGVPGSDLTAEGAGRSREETPERGGRVAEVTPSLDDDAAGTRRDDASPASRRRSEGP
jgi:hypothetical protein